MGVDGRPDHQAILDTFLEGLGDEDITWECIVVGNILIDLKKIHAVSTMHVKKLSSVNKG